VSGIKDIKVFSGTAHPDFTKSICSELGIRLSAIKHFRFSDGEMGITVEESVRGSDVFVVQPTCYPSNDNLMELLIMVDAFKRASASRVNVVIPYFGYARQDRKNRPRDPITAKLVTNLITNSGADRVISTDLHAGQIQGFFDIPVDHLTGMPLLASHFKELLKAELNRGDVIVVSPDVGGVVRARHFAVMLKTDLAIVDKRRSYEVANFCEVMDIIGEVNGKTAILVDDIIDTAGTICNAASGLKQRGCVTVFACATHAVLSGPAMKRINGSEIDKVVFSDTIPLHESKRSERMVQLSIAPLFAEAILRVHSDRSVSSLFENKI